MNKIFRIKFAVFAATCVAVGGVSHADEQEEFAPMFPFVISHETLENATNMSHLLDAPAGKHGFVRVQNGRFATDAGPIKFNATNLTGAANFPTHEDADTLAARLARFGINCVRLHYMDAPYGNFRNKTEPSIFGSGDSVPKEYQADPNVIVPFDAGELDKLDYLVAALKKRGIYVNINLHVRRFAKGRSFVSPSIFASEKEYAKRLLTHVNPYTKLAYTDDPCVAMIEINNENSLFGSYHKGVTDQLPEPYASEFRAKWNAWLKKKYASTAAMRKAWNWKAASFGEEQIPEGGFEKPVSIDGKKWKFSLGTAKASAASENGVMKIAVEQEGEKHYPKLLRGGIKLKKGESYTISFKVRRLDAKGKAELGCAIADTGKGWKTLGYLRTLDAVAKWTEINDSFVAKEDSDKAQLQITRFKKGAYEIANLSIKSGAESGLDESENLENGTVSTIKYKSAVPAEAKRDFYKFIEDTENDYWLGLYDYIKHTLKAKAPVAGTQLRYSLTSSMAKLDYVDNHAYWAHPNPNKNWKISNTSMVNSMKYILALAEERVLGKPYTISEYNHPFPNHFGAEAQPMLRAYGAFQGWDGVFEYTWNHRRAPEPGHMTYFFSISERTDALAHMPACAAIYLRGDVTEAKKTVGAAADFDKFFESFTEAGKGISLGIEKLGFNRELALLHKTGILLDGKNASNPESSNKEVADAKIITSDTGELTWNREDAEAGYFTVNTAGTKLFTGFPNGRTILMGDLSLKLGKTRLDWATVSLVSRFAKDGFGQGGKSANILLTATGLALNNEMKLQKVGEHTLSEIKWGGAPFMVEGISATITLPSNAARTSCYALNPKGERGRKVPVEANGEGCKIVIDPKYKTVWYEIEVK